MDTEFGHCKDTRAAEEIIKQSEGDALDVPVPEPVEYRDFKAGPTTSFRYNKYRNSVTITIVNEGGISARSEVSRDLFVEFYRRVLQPEDADVQ